MRFLHLALSSLLLANPLLLAAAEGDKSFSGHIDVVSRYILRGASTTYGTAPVGNAGADAPESDKPALQWGIDYAAANGFYAGYWASTVNYSYKQLGNSYADRSIVDFQKDKSIENDLYAGYNGKAGEFSYTLGATAYVYIKGKHADGLETKLGVGYGAFTLNVQTLLNDVVWGNRGDSYWTLNYNTALPQNIALNVSLGYYSYKKQGKYLGSVDTLSGAACAAGQSFVVNGCYAGGAPSSGAFRHLNVGITQPIANTGVTWGLTGILGGETRFGYKQGNRLVGSLSYGF